MRKELQKYKGYFVSDSGEVFKDDLKLIQHTNAAGHRYVYIGNNICTVAYLVANAFVDNVDNGLIVGFKDNNKTNVKADNLYWYYSGESDEDVENYHKKPIYKCNLNGNIITEYKTSAEAAKANNIPYYKLRDAQIDVTVYDNMAYIPKVYYNSYSIKYKIAQAINRNNKHSAKIVTNEKTNTVKKLTNYCKIIQINEKGKIIKEYTTIKQLADTLKVKFNTISQQLFHKKYYKNENDNNIYIRQKDYTEAFVNEVFKNLKENKKKGNRIVQISKDGEVIKEYQTIRAAAAAAYKLPTSIVFKIKRYGFYEDNAMILTYATDWENESKRQMIIDKLR